ncbi:MAG TPA: enoyl-CoA hydratase/isomerase family protein [Anaerolineales bacterium]|nr:enoyl-CoA hydratase/isomerase family protein [Anaerolineales bacterium]
MPAEANEFISLEIQDSIAILTLDRPPLNVLHIPMLEQLESVLASLAGKDTLRVMILEARGKMFSAGVDVADHTADKVSVMIPLFNRVCQALAEFPLPTLAAVHGHALGGGCELVLCCDLAVIAESAKIGQPEIHLAAFAPIAAMRLPQLVGLRAAADMLFTGRSLTAQEALSLGLVNALVPVDQVAAWARDKAGQIAGLSRVALALTKRALQLGFGNWEAISPEMEGLYLQDLMQSHDAAEGLAAFMEKRKPIWQDR